MCDDFYDETVFFKAPIIKSSSIMRVCSLRTFCKFYDIPLLYSTFATLSTAGPINFHIKQEVLVINNIFPKCSLPDPYGPLTA